MAVAVEVAHDRLLLGHAFGTPAALGERPRHRLEGAAAQPERLGEVEGAGVAEHPEVGHVEFAVAVEVGGRQGRAGLRPELECGLERGEAAVARADRDLEFVLAAEEVRHAVAGEVAGELDAEPLG